MLRVGVISTGRNRKCGASGASDRKACASNRGPGTQWALDRLATHIYHYTYSPDTANTLPESMQFFLVITRNITATGCQRTAAGVREIRNLHGRGPWRWSL